MSLKRLAALFALLLTYFAIVRTSPAQTLPSGPQVLTFFSDVDDSEQPYALYLPKNFDSSKKYPLVVSLHGAGSNHRLNLRRVFGKSNQNGENDVEASRYFPSWPDVDYIVASPLARGTMGYQGIAEKDVYDVLEDVKKRFPIDDNRVYLTGLSMGGGGTLWLGLTRPDVWAAIAPVCPAPPEGTLDLAGNALNLPVNLHQGGADPVVKPEGTREWVKKLEELGGKVEYHEYPGVSHDSWVNAYKDGEIFDWFGKFRRESRPDRVRFATTKHKYHSAYWVDLDEFKPGSLAKIDAKFTGPNQLEIATNDLEAFTLHLAGHPKFDAGQSLKVTIDGKSIQINTRDLIPFSKNDGVWSLGKRYHGANVKGPNAEGPIAEVVAARHLYVYGTLDNPSPDELRKRRSTAARAADWSFKANDASPMASYFSQMKPPSVFFRVVADKEVRPSDLETSNLVLFGTKETNRLIAKHADRLPLHLKGDASGYGLIYVFPIGSHSVLVNSGLPWWTVAEANSTPPPGGATNRRPRFRFSGWPTGLLGEFKDYRLFKDHFENVIAEGSFDSQWSVPASDLEKLKASDALAPSSSAKTADADDPANGVLGAWRLKFDAPDGQHYEPLLTLTKADDGLKGSYKNDEGDLKTREVSFKDGRLSFKVDGQYNGQAYTLTFSGKTEANSVKGETKYEYGDQTGSFEFEGTRDASHSKK